MLVSIVTVNYNDREGLRTTLNSIRDQKESFNDFEVIVIDAGSNDGSKDVIREYSTLIAKSVSEPDRGIFDGMNKGLNFCTGEFVIFLNSGDRFWNSNTLSSIQSELIKGLVNYGSVTVNSKGKTWTITRDEKSKFMLAPNHQAIFYPQKFYENNNYDLSLGLASDIDYSLKAIKKCGCNRVDKVVSEFMYDGCSSNINSFSKAQVISNQLFKIYRGNGYPLSFCSRFYFSYLGKYLLQAVSPRLRDVVIKMYNSRSKL